MAECPACLGEGGHDFSDTNAVLREHLPDEALARIEPLEGWQVCDVCGGSGCVPDDVRADMIAAAVARVDQVKAAIAASEQAGARFRKLIRDALSE